MKLALASILIIVLLLLSGCYARDDKIIINSINSVEGNFSVGGIFNNVPPHMYGIATEQQTAVSSDTWYNISFNKSIGDINKILFDSINNDTLTINYSGHYSIMFGISVIDVSPSPNAEVAFRITVNGVELEGSYFEITTTKQNAVQFQEHLTHSSLMSGDELNMQWITSDTDVSINNLNTYSNTRGHLAYGYIIRVGGE